MNETSKLGQIKTAGAQKNKPKSTISTSSLPDIIFMLLIFFMVTTVMKSYEGLKTRDPSAKEIEQFKNKKNVCSNRRFSSRTLSEKS